MSSSTNLVSIGTAPAGRCPYHAAKAVGDLDAVRSMARELITSHDPAKLALAEAALEEVKGDDEIGETHQLLGLAQFMQEKYDAAGASLEVAVARNPGNEDWRVLLERTTRNTVNQIAVAPRPTDEFDPVKLGSPPALYLREPRDIKPLVPATLGERATQLFQDLGGAAAGVILGVATKLATRHGIPAAWKEWPAIPKGAPLARERKDMKIGGIRNWMNKNTIKSPERPGELVDGQAVGQKRPEWTKRFRTADGSWNTDDPREGAAGARLAWMGKDPISEVRRDRSLDPDLPDVRTLSLDFLASSGPQKRAPFLSLQAIGWIQFMLEGWVRHRQADLSTHQGIEVKLGPNDPARLRYGQDTMLFRRTQPDVLPNGNGTAYRSESTAWWGGNQIYGNDQATQDRIRTDPETGEFLADGKLYLPDGQLPVDAKGRELSGATQNWWIARSPFHLLFAKHHNYVCDVIKTGRDPYTGERLGDGHPDWSTDQLFHTARLVNAACMAKIHTDQWTPAVLPTPELALGMNANWSGLLDAAFMKFNDRKALNIFDITNDILGGLVGGVRDGFGSPYAFPEQFSEVYRLHAGVPEEVAFYEPGKTEPVETVKTDATREQGAQALLKRHGLGAVFYSLGMQKMPLLVHNNYPPMFTDLSTEGMPVMDLGAADLLRARERGVPPYNEFRRQLGLPPIARFEDLGVDAETLAKLKKNYGTGPEGVEKLDLLVGTLCEGDRPLLGFGQTLFAVFVQAASGRLKRDPFFSRERYNHRYYSKEGIQLVDRADLRTIELMHCPELKSSNLGKVDEHGEPLVHNPFEPLSSTWKSAPEEHPLKSSGAEHY